MYKQHLDNGREKAQITSRYNKQQHLIHTLWLQCTIQAHDDRRMTFVTKQTQPRILFWLNCCSISHIDHDLMDINHFMVRCFSEDTRACQPKNAASCSPFAVRHSMGFAWPVDGNEIWWFFVCFGMRMYLYLYVYCVLCTQRLTSNANVYGICER